MPVACAEVTLDLLTRLRRKFADRVRVIRAETVIRQGRPTIFLATLESPLISDMTPHVEIVVEGASLWFKPAREA